MKDAIVFSLSFFILGFLFGAIWQEHSRVGDVPPVVLPMSTP